MSGFENFKEIRRVYAQLLPEWMLEYEATGDMRHDPYFIDWKFSPIESLVWGDIRTLGLPFYPQVPVLNYFIDFACPMLKIGIECDGKAWHDKDLDRARDARLAAQGWMIFRIEGHECFRTIEPWSEGYEEDSRLVDLYFSQTAAGVLSAIKSQYFDECSSPRHQYLIEATLFEHRSTPENYPIRKPVLKSHGPVRLSELLAGYAELMSRRMRRASA